MNPQAHRLIFNPHRGQLMAVAETTSAQGKSASGESPITGAAAVVACIALAFSLLQALPPPSQAFSSLSDLASIQPIALITPALTAIYSGASSLFHPTPSPTAHYLVETDPRFANYKTWLSSDYMLSALNIDPATTQKRLGDGFYEQKLIREQVLSLTGQRFLGDFSSDEAEYQALMSAGVTFAQAYDLRPGIALTPAQVAHLTSNIVWLETATVDLPDGGSTQVLMPKVYMAVHPGDLESHGALLAAKSVAITTTGDITNSGSITGAGAGAGAASGAAVRLTAQNIHNVGGLIQGDTVRAAATQDLNNIGGVIRADSTLVVSAGRDVNSVSTVRRQTLAANGGPSSGEVTNLDQVAGLYVGTAASNTPTSAPQANGTLVVAAGRDVKLQGSALASTGRVQVAAGNNIVLGVVQTSSTQSQVLDAGNAHSHASTTAVASGISAQGDIALRAGQDVQAQGAQVSSQQGALDVSAARDVLLSSAQNTTSASSLHTSQSHGLLSSSRETSSLDERQSTAQGSALSGNTVSLHAGRDATITGSNVVSDSATAIAAANTLTITGAQNTQTTSSFSQKTESGLLSGGGFGVTVGHRDLSQDAGNTRTSNAASTVGSVGGNVTLSGKNYVQTGSDVATPGQGGPSGGGDITINAQNVAITEARESSNSQTQTKFSQSGITVAISNPVVGAVQSADQLRQAASKTSDGRMQALAAGSAALGAKSAVTDKDGKFDADKASSVSVSVSLGQSKSQSNSTTTADTAGLSTLTAGGNITINAKTVNGGELANPADSNITLQGVQIKAGDAVTLDADNRVNVLAAKNTQTQSSTNSSSSASVGVAIQYGAKGTGYGFTAAASAARGSSDGTDTTYTNSHIDAGNQVNITSGGDTTIKGGVVTANTVKANVGGDLKVESLQDTSVFTGKQSSAGGSVMIGAGGGGSVSASKTAINNNFASVAEQSGIRAGDGGFQVSTKGDTTLTGGAITSTQAAVDSKANTFTTAKLTTSDLQNTASYSANSVGGTLGTGSLSTSSGAGLGHKSADASSTTAAAISGLAGNTAARTGDKETGIAVIFDKTAVRDDVNAQVLITTKTGQQASREVATYADGKATDLRNQAEQAGKELDPAKQQDLLAQAKTWDEGGSNRVALHAGVGLVTGGAAGAAGAATVAAAAPMLNEVQANVASKLETAGLNKTLAANIAQGVTGAAVLGAGVATGSAGAAVAGFNGDTNNRQLHPTEAKLIKDNAKRFAQSLYGTDSPTAAQIDAAQERLTSTTLNQINSSFDKRITTEDQQAQTFLKDLAARTGNVDVGGGQLFDARGTSSFTNNTINAQYLDQTAPLYNQLDSKDLKGVVPNVRGAYVAYSDANNDPNLKNLTPQQILDIAKTGQTLKGQVQSTQEQLSISSAGIGRTESTLGKNGIAKPGDGSRLSDLGISTLTEAAVTGIPGDGSPVSGQMGGASRTVSKLPSTSSEFVPGYIPVDLPNLPSGARGVIDPTSGEMLILTNKGTLQQPTMKTGNPVLDAPVLSHPDGTIWSPDIKSQGAMGEVVLNRDNRGVGLHNNEPVIDVFDAQTGQAVSIKTLDWNTAAKINNPASVETTIRGQVNDLVNYEGTKANKGIIGNAGLSIDVNDIKTKTLELVLPATGGTPEQVAAVNRAIDYAKQRGVTITVVKAK